MLILQDAEDVLLSLMNQVDTLTRYTNDCLKVRHEQLDMDVISVSIPHVDPESGHQTEGNLHSFFVFSKFQHCKSWKDM
jgi:hypothetical protein